eukprot:jgi/Tetstr1/454179/TSEL_041098.t1
MDGDPRVAAFEMLMRRIGDVEDTMLRTERLFRDQGAAADVRDILLTPVTDLVNRTMASHERLYRLCERLEDLLHQAVDAATRAGDPRGVVDVAVARLRELGASRLTFLMLCQISNMTDDLELILDLVGDRRIVPDADALAFALHAEDIACRYFQDRADRREAIYARVETITNDLRMHWKAVGFQPGRPWSIASY